MVANRKRLRKFLRKVNASGKRLTLDNLDSFRKRINGQGLSNIAVCRMAFPRQFGVLTKLRREDAGLVKCSDVLKLIAIGDFNRCPSCEKAIRFSSDYCRRCSPATEQHIRNVRKAQDANGGHPMRRPEVISKFTETMLSRHGVCWAAQDPSILEKVHSTHAQRHGGHKHWAQTKEGRERIRELNHDPIVQKNKAIKWAATLQAKYGDDWRVVNHERLSKTRYKYHDIELAGVTYRCQGYEPVALRWLHENQIDIKGAQLSTARYPYKKSSTGKRSVYLPDIVLPSTGWVIEVKCGYTAGFGDTDHAQLMWKQLQEKSRAVYSAGQHLDLLVCNSKRVLLRIRDPHKISRRSALRLYTDALARLD